MVWVDNKEGQRVAISRTGKLVILDERQEFLGRGITNSRSNYDLAAGDRPEVFGHQAAFWVMNDVGNVHQSTDSPPIGLEDAHEGVVDLVTMRAYTFEGDNGEKIVEGDIPAALQVEAGEHLFVEGRQVVRDGQIATLDLPRVIERQTALVRALMG